MLPKEKEKKITPSDTLKKKLEESTTKLAQMQNWDTMEGGEDDWDED